MPAKAIRGEVRDRVNGRSNLYPKLYIISNLYILVN
jgi:hypothetical protein